MPGNLNHLIIDVTDPSDQFECEGKVIQTFFSTTDVFNFQKSKVLIRPKTDLRRKIKSFSRSDFNIFHLAAHGIYYRKTKQKLDYTAIYQKRGKREIEVFRPDTIVRLRLMSDLFLSTCCETFNDYFLEVIKGYGGVNNFIAPVDSPISGDTIIFSLLFYNSLIRDISRNQKRVLDPEIRRAFGHAKKAYQSYPGKGDFRLYCHTEDKIYLF